MIVHLFADSYTAYDFILAELSLYIGLCVNMSMPFKRFEYGYLFI